MYLSSYFAIIPNENKYYRLIESLQPFGPSSYYDVILDGALFQSNREAVCRNWNRVCLSCNLRILSEVNESVVLKFEVLVFISRNNRMQWSLLCVSNKVTVHFNVSVPTI